MTISRSPLRRAPALFALLFCAVSARADEGKWERKEFTCKEPEKGCYIAGCCQDIDFALSTRARAGTPIMEVKATGDVDAPPERVFAAITDFEHQAGNMPYVKDQKVFSRSDTGAVFWTVADFPLISARDWLLKATFEKNFDGGKYRVSWEPIEVKEAAPPADGVVRITVNTGSWLLEPLDGGKRTRATYALFTDPGGSIPSFVANKANTTALPDLFAAVRKRATAAR
jgi:hypothetical protein